jgi:hypothetical protein
VQFGRDEGEHLDQADAAELAARRELRRALGDPAEDRDVLGQELAVIEHQRRYVAFGIDLREVAALLGALGAQVDPDAVERQARFMQRDVFGEAARAGREIELHETASCCLWIS